ncbi:MAG: hypothetical protein ACR2FG_11240 [Marmoricola sp.]
MKRTDDFKISPDDGYRYSAPDSDRERREKETGYLILAALAVLVLLAVATGKVTVFFY